VLINNRVAVVTRLETNHKIYIGHKVKYAPILLSLTMPAGMNA
jgi:hypothetical protein